MVIWSTVSSSNSIRAFCSALTHRVRRTPGISGRAAPASDEAGLPLRHRAERTSYPEFTSNKFARESFRLSVDVKLKYWLRARADASPRDGRFLLTRNPLSGYRLRHRCAPAVPLIGVLT